MNKSFSNNCTVKATLNQMGGAPETSFESFKSKRILFFTNLICLSDSGPKVLKMHLFEVNALHSFFCLFGFS